MKNNKLTMNNETRKGGKIAFLSLFTFLFSLFLFGCLNPFDPPRTATPGDGVGYFALSLSVEGGARTIIPTMDQDYFIKYRLEFFATGTTASPVKTILLNPDQLDSNQLSELIELPLGEYDLVVTAYVNFVETDEALNKAAAKGTLSPVNIRAGVTTGGNVKLYAIEEGFGTFSWDIQYPEGAKAQMTIEPLVGSGLTPYKEWTLTETPTLENEIGNEASLELRSGMYRVTFDLMDSDSRSLQRSEILHVYQNMISHFRTVFIEDYFVITRITNIELELAEVETGIELPLVAKISPPEATFTDVKWEIVTDSDKTGATVDYNDQNGVFYSEGAEKEFSTVKVRATVEHGAGYMVDYTKELDVKILFVHVKSISLSKNSITLADGMSEELTVTINPDNATNKMLKWEPNDESIFEVDYTGKPNDDGLITALITALKPGDTFVLVYSISDTSAEAQCEVHVSRVPVTNITINAEYVYLPPTDGKTTMRAIIAPPNATDKSLLWETDDYSKTVIKLDSVTGEVEVVGAHNTMAKVWATSNGGPGTPPTPISSQECTIMILNSAGSVDGIELNVPPPEEFTLRLEVGRSVQLIPRILPTSATSVLYWISGDDTVVSVDNGTITAHSPGKATIAVTTQTGGRIAECLVEAYAKDDSKPAVTGITLGTVELPMVVGYPERIPATITPANAANKTLVWRSSDETVATVNSTGLVTPVYPGGTTITVITEDSGLMASYAITVKHTDVTDVQLNLPSLKMDTGAANAVQLLATVIPFNASVKDVKWETNAPGVATVTDDGTVTFLGGGSAIITVTSLDNPEASATCTIRARDGNPAVDNIKLNTNELRVALDGPAPDPLVAVLTPSDAQDKNVYWYSYDNLIAEVSVNGLVIPKRTGTVKITVTAWDGGSFDECMVTVYEGTMAAGDIKLNTDRLTLTSTGALSANGRTAQLIATVLPDGATSAISWKTRDAAVATVVNGLVTANAPGTAVITATTVEGGFMASCTVTVDAADIAATGVRLSANSLNLERGGTNASATLTVYREPAAATTDIVWSSVNPAVARVDPSSGLITAVASGTTAITATTVDGGHRVSCAVTVRALNEYTSNVTGVELSANELTLVTGRSGTLHAFIKPIVNAQSESTATNKTVHWSSNDTTIATVNNGVITTSKSGTVRIMVTTDDGGYTDVCVVTIGQALGTTVNGLALNMKSLTLNQRTWIQTLELDTGEIKPTITPENATEKDLIWYNSNPAVATVDKSGNVTAGALGKTVIIVTTAIGGFAQRVDVTVVPSGTGNTPPSIGAVFRITINPNTLSFDVDDSQGVREYTGKLTITVEPANAANKEISWTASQNGVVRIDADGVVTALKPGRAVITGTTVDGGKTNTFTVTVRGLFEKLLPAGTYNMQGNRPVTLTKAFYMGSTLVTQELWQKVMTPVQNGISATPSYFNGSSGRAPAAGEVQELRPVDSINWYDMLVFCNRLSVLRGLEPVYEMQASTGSTRTSDTSQWGNVPTVSDTRWNLVSMISYANGYRLPTEAEWEYACRAGTTLSHYWEYVPNGLYYAWLSRLDGVVGSEPANNITHQVGLKLGNPWGLYDMNGNLWEACWDWYNGVEALPTTAVTDYMGPGTGTYRMLRGASWNNNTVYQASSSYRGGAMNSYERNNYIGIRVVRQAEIDYSPSMVEIPAVNNVTLQNVAVRLSAFKMSTTTVTQGLWRKVMRPVQNNISAEPSYFHGGSGREPVAGEIQERRPVEQVSWYETLVFCNRLSVLEGLTPAYEMQASTGTTRTSDTSQWGNVPTGSDARWNAVTVVAGSTGYRLPTESQWEYACRGGTAEQYSYYYRADGTGANIGTDTWSSNYGWFSVNTTNRIPSHQVGLKWPNGYGLYDMHGNVWEKCWDWFETPFTGGIDPVGPASGLDRSIRGSSWYDTYGPSYNRAGHRPERKDWAVGFRLVRP